MALGPLPNEPPRYQQSKQAPLDIESQMSSHDKGIGDGVQEWLDDVRYEVNHPSQVKRKHRKWVRFFGQVGWVGKGVMYAMIGGLACKSAAEGSKDDSSPQGAILVLGSGNGGDTKLVFLAIAISFYIVWRFWEGITGQGFDETFPTWKNFFKFRLSPFVSGMVYLSYLVFILSLLFDRKEDASGGFPEGWSKTTIGDIGLGVIGVAFLVAFIVQLVTALRRAFHADYRKDIPPPVRKFTLFIGHIGYLARGLFFLMLAILFFRDIEQEMKPRQPGSSQLGEGLGQLQTETWGRIIIFIIGFMLVIYGLFAVLSAYARYFPTPPPSRIAKHHCNKYGEFKVQPQPPRETPNGTA